MYFTQTYINFMTVHASLPCTLIDSLQTQLYNTKIVSVSIGKMLQKYPERS